MDTAILHSRNINHETNGQKEISEQITEVITKHHHSNLINYQGKFNRLMLNLQLKFITMTKNKVRLFKEHQQFHKY